MADPHRAARPRSQRGVVLILVLVVLLVVTMIGTSALNSTMLDMQVAGNASESYTAFQAAENLLAVAEAQDISIFTTAITAGTGSETALVIAAEVSDPYPNTDLAATLRYTGEGTVAFGSSIAKFKPQRFEATAEVERTGSGARATHRQGILILSPGS